MPGSVHLARARNVRLVAASAQTSTATNGCLVANKHKKPVVGMTMSAADAPDASSSPLRFATRHRPPQRGMWRPRLWLYRAPDASHIFGAFFVLHVFVLSRMLVCARGVRVEPRVEPAVRAVFKPAPQRRRTPIEAAAKVPRRGTPRETVGSRYRAHSSERSAPV